MAEVFVSGIPSQWAKADLELFLQPHLKALLIYTYHCSKPKNKGYGFLTFVDIVQARIFLEVHGGPKHRISGNRVYTPLKSHRGLVKFEISNKQPEDLRIKALEGEEMKRRQRLGQAASNSRKDSKPSSRSFLFSSLECGIWGEGNPTTVFLSQFSDRRNGIIIFGRSSLAIILGSTNPKEWVHRIDIPYLDVDSVVTGSKIDPTVTFTLKIAPRIFKRSAESSSGENPVSLDPRVDILHAFENTSITPKPSRESRIRIPNLGAEHEACVATCFVYRLTLIHAEALHAVSHLLAKRGYGMPSHMSCQTKSLPQPFGHRTELQELQELLGKPEGIGNLPFMLKYQIEKLAVNGCLKPSVISKLLPRIGELCEQYGETAITQAVRSLYGAIPVIDPYTESDWFSPEFISDQLKEDIKLYHEKGSIYDIDENHEHIALIHRVTVTPAGYYLEGPFPENMNRILREHAHHTDMFMRVLFADENGESLRFDPMSTPNEIYNVRFQAAINNPIKIGGRRFTFLGFSHSSLRSQTCWFMAPFVENGSLIHAKEVIKSLGDFTKIRCPAKCAARIGQAFSDTTASITVPKGADHEIDDIKRNDRVFSDGVGTISSALLRRVWASYSLNRTLKPTVLQIRYKGAKGVVSLDTRLNGEKLLLRPSMVKFHGTGDKLEICGANLNPLPLYLNRPLIKILEDLGVPGEIFMDLQASALTSLRLMTINDVNAAEYLETNHMCGGQRLPSLLRYLSDIGLPSQADRFLRDTIEVAALVRLREMKYRARIPVDLGKTLYGIMDETGILEEGQIYCVTETEKEGRQVLSGGKAVITRSPAMHPGDVQMVQCVDVPDDSPLNALHNCVVFSQKGDRDLPSQLGGGDLDGDLYNVIYDPRLLPKRTTAPADYPRPVAKVIDREVETKDMTDFFIEFMLSDQLGRIANIHQQLADRHPEGTFHPDCLTLAEMASVAVDFSKTGVPVDMRMLPKYTAKDLRPDFMAPGPRVQMSGEGVSFEEEEIMEEERDAVLALDPNFEHHSYYESKKILGKLYRAIDESKFLQEMKTEARRSVQCHLIGEASLMERLWKYIETEAAVVRWTQYEQRAREIRQSYESNIYEIMIAHSSHPSHPLTEVEVFSGTILGKTGGAANKRTRELAGQMKIAYERDVAYFRELIKYEDTVFGRGDREESEQEALPRAMACLYVGLEPWKKWKGRQLESFKYVAAEICLTELLKWMGQRSILKKIS